MKPLPPVMRMRLNMPDPKAWGSGGGVYAPWRGKPLTTGCYHRRTARPEATAMTEEDFRRLVLSFPGAAEASHMGHPDFRLGGRIFATIFWTEDGDSRRRVKLTPQQQARFVADKPGMFAPIPGGWGRQGCTEVRLDQASKPWVRRALEAAWGNRASSTTPPKPRSRSRAAKKAQPRRRPSGPA